MRFQLRQPSCIIIISGCSNNNCYSCYFLFLISCCPQAACKIWILLITSSWNRKTAPQFLLFLLSSFVHSFTPSFFYKCMMRTWSIRRGQSVAVRQDSLNPVPNAQVCVHLTVHIKKLQLQTIVPKPLYIRHFTCIYRDPGRWKSWCLHYLWPVK